MKNKKAISPLIASVLLIGVTVALAALVMTFIGGYGKKSMGDVESQGEKQLLCATQLIFDVKLICPDKITIDNKGAVGIKGFLVRLYAPDGTITSSESDKIKPIVAYAVGDLTTTFTTSTKKVEVIAIAEDGTPEGLTCGEAPREAIVPSCQLATP